MDQEHREAIQAANRRRSNCPRGNVSSFDVRDGKEIGGVPTVKYRCCNACGWQRAITKRMPKFKL